MENIKRLLKETQFECERLRKENIELRNLLKAHNIDFNPPQRINQPTPNKTKEETIQERIQLFKSLFKGRADVYAMRWESKTGKSGYSPACANEWHATLCEKPKIKCNSCQHRKLLPLTDQVIYNHLIGKQTIGLYPLLEDETCWFLAVDFDKQNWKEDAQAFMNTCKEYRVPASIERSRSGNGCHVWIFFDDAVPASLARQLGNGLLTHTLEKRYKVGIDSFDRLFPNQDTLPKGGFGNLIALPLQYAPRKQQNSVFVDESFIPYPDQWGYLSQVKKMNRNAVEKITQIMQQKSDSTSNIKDETYAINYPTKLKITEKNGLYIDKEGLPSSLIQKLIQLSSFRNPEFYKAQAKRLSTHGIPRHIISYEETDEFFIFPRGCKDEITSLLKKHSIEIEHTNETNQGTALPVTFAGKLRVEQEQAVTNLLEQPTGILSATTGFGKTVVAAALIAKRKVNTLVIVHRKQLIEQWKDRLTSFLNLEAHQIGQIGGGKNKQSGVIDIATIQSLNYKGEIKDHVTQYGQIIVDECHHISAYSFEQVLKKATAAYIHGLTATPTRKDGLHPIMTMQLGPIRYKVQAKSQAKVRPFEHLVTPRYTTFMNQDKQEERNLQELYNELINNEKRNQMIFDDVLKELEEGAAPLILSERVEHVHHLEAMFKNFAKNIIVLTGGMKKQEEKEKINRLENMSDDEERLIIATGKYIGEGFDHSRLDTLFLTMPISWKGTLQQYVGRLHRLHDKKTRVKVFDYVDAKEPMFAAMYEKRAKAYQAMGYKQIDKKLAGQATDEQMRLF
ncbi:TOTE conflict system archaeo-eukaryotic primase domain-containing protein [Metabacillus malikii]|uniref:Superfamily II DNA or RNA helicase n=1 Tax=Metabacillus malikii TaxID=1504265 RepID=A0ABT9ZKF3_9BACI|nr:DEAD/DEAH box helicase [Metabacillus malikii]MDQ0232771.1 superfamily II DNA or RNA helicase [Metabacillus malikii]